MPAVVIPAVARQGLCSLLFSEQFAPAFEARICLNHEIIDNVLNFIDEKQRVIIALGHILSRSQQRPRDVEPASICWSSCLLLRLRFYPLVQKHYDAIQQFDKADGQHADVIGLHQQRLWPL